MSDISETLVKQVSSAFKQSTPLKIIAGGSKAFIGREAQGEPLNVSEHKGIVSYHPSELVMTARCGTSMTEIQQTLAENGQYCPFESALFDGAATLGGTLATNLSGPARPWNGSIRDAVIGTRLINGKGEYLKFGGQVMKNVAGYDVSRLQAGALGTLGVITEISFKVLPLPAASGTVVLAMNASEAIKLMNQVSAKAVPVSGSAWLDGNLYLRYSGATKAVDSALKQFKTKNFQQLEPQQADEFWSAMNEQKLDFFKGEAPLWRFSLKSNATHLLDDQNWLIDWGGAQRWLRGDFNQSELEQQAQHSGGQVSLFRYGERSNEVNHTLSEVQKKIHKNLKASFDPKQILNPGRLYSWL
ncbi:MAG: glycolate oxidase subunit GlcE [gamma proteobacterium symbiont of Bathyaustriella thionipta]|nr:glycolate oxidase subunit GlcE [gamma proteobacterium symbiont of Bathyaustriella thionipta]MCU7949415.1 glycolate oxidase subunit GlcE [gamma proteobacterium symbiont of Bathyaustriella thionipta]MCU7953091.1 glycolate oxidase subunit GlcE [gamma proteobacterium symbiont of Bathyaustriella thionipta]MCU7956002.1 glycolate oxidase subunit GlcE [gamma proteobacterium symbiont of Bathyaustriella thionipta]MCU7968955.1 glycolate oxidase subunit GlcE [gamma proteobacterium symbiont of Bathyaustr